MANPAITIYLLFAVIHLTLGLTVDIPELTYEVARGQSVTIRCTFKPAKPANKRVIISWLAHPDNPEDSEIDVLTHYYTVPDSGPITEESDVGENYADRVTQQLDIAKGTADLTIKALTSNDNRKYDCKVKIPGDTLGKQSDTTSVVVLVTPSKPICNVQGTMEFFHNINLTCRSEEGMPKPTYKWERRDFTDKLQPNPVKSTDVNGVLSLYNISTDIDGYYICTSLNKIGSASCNMTVTVRQSSMNIASTAGIIGACVAALLLFGIIIYCCCCRKKKDQSEEYDLGMQADEYSDKEPIPIEGRKAKEMENKPDKDEEHGDHQDNRRDNYDSQGVPADRQYDHDDRRSDRYDDRRSDRYDDRRSDRYDDRRSDRNDDRKSDRYDDSRDRYDDRRRDYHDDSRDRYDDRRRDYHDDSRDHYDDRRRDHVEDRFDERQDHYDHPDDRRRPPNLPTNKPPRA